MSAMSGWTPTKEAPTPTTAAIERITGDAELVAFIRQRIADVNASARLDGRGDVKPPEAGAIARDLTAARGLAVSRFTDWEAVGAHLLPDPMDAARHACRVSETGEHTCLDDPALAERYAEFVVGDSPLPVVPEGDGGAPVSGFEVAACAFETGEDGRECVSVVLVSEAQFWTVYATYEGAPTYAVADYSERVVAEHVAAKLAAASGVDAVTLDF